MLKIYVKDIQIYNRDNMKGRVGEASLVLEA